MFAAVRGFFLSRELGEDINHTTVAIIPTVPIPKFITQLRPISCCNFVYKVIAKVIVGRLKPLMNNIISRSKVPL